MSKDKTNKIPLVIIEWNDAHGGAGWTPNIEEHHKPLKVKTVGFLFKDDETGISTSDGFDEHGSCCGYSFIPRAMITKVTKVKY